MASIHQLKPGDFKDFVAKDLLASARTFRLYAEVHFSYPKHETLFVIYNGKAIVGKHTKVKDAVAEYNELTKDIK